MWFVFVEIFFLISLSFLLGAGITALAIRILLRGSDNEATDAAGGTS